MSQNVIANVTLPIRSRLATFLMSVEIGRVRSRSFVLVSMPQISTLG